MIDFRTVILITGLTHLVQLAVFIVLYRTSRQYKGVGMWLGWCIAEFIGFSFLLLRQIPEIFELAVIMQNTCVVIGPIFVYFGVRQFFGQDPHIKLMLTAYTVYVFLLVYFLFVTDSIQLRSFFTNLTLAVVSVPAIITLFRHKPASVRITALFIGWVMVVHCLVFLYRTVIIVKGVDFGKVYEPSIFNFAAYMDALLVGLLWTYGFVIIVAQRTHADLAESKNRFESIFKTSPDAVAITRMEDGMFMECNSAFTVLSGRSRDEVIGKTSLEVNVWKNPADRDKVLDPLRTQGIALNFEFPFVRKDGTSFTGLMSASLMSLDGKAAILSTTRDISARKHEEAERLEAENRHQAYAAFMSEIIARKGFGGAELLESLEIIDEVASGIMRCARTGTWLFSEDYSSLKCIDTYISEKNEHEKGDNLAASEFPEYISELKKGIVIAAEDVLTHEVTRHLPGSYFTSYGISSMLDVPVWFEGNLKGVVCFEHIGENRKWKSDEQQFAVTVASVVSLLLEIAERRKAEKELLIATEKAQQSDRLKSTFLANMSHEIRTPMNSIVGFAQLLADPDLSPEMSERYTAIIQSRSDDLMHIINELLEISRIESGNTKVISSNIDINSLMDDLEILTIQKLEKTGKKDLSIVKVKPMESQDSLIYTDSYILKQVFTNLIDNAIKYTPKGEIRFGYDIPENQMIRFFVSDSGLGISEENQKIIFEHFRQADIEQAHHFGGTGLGLSICKGALALLGGNIWVESSPGLGSTFRFEIPYQKASPANTGGTASTSTGPLAVSGKWPGKRILLVEDEVSNMEYLQAILGKTETELFYVYNGRQLREQYARLDQFNLVLLDVRLPDAIGWDLAREIKKIRPSLPIIAQTAFAMSSDQLKSRESGCDEYISKPIRKETLLKMIDRFLAS